jgi:hypothetical protein
MLLHLQMHLQEKLPWSEEVLVSKSELEERRNHVAELEQQVAELTMQTEYQLRLKELHLQVRSVTATFTCSHGMSASAVCSTSECFDINRGMKQADVLPVQL